MIGISHAIVCPPGKNISAAATIGVPDDARAALQHQKYIEALKQCGVIVATLAPDATLPNSCLTGNVAVITENLAIIGNFSNYSPRQGEQKNIASALAGDKFLKFVTAPGLLDADDVLRIRNHFYIGLSDHTNHEGAAQLAFFLTEFGYEVTVREQETENVVRLGTAATWLGHNTLLIREELARHFAFLTFDKIIVPHRERGATNAQLVNGILLLAAGYAETAAAVKNAVEAVIEINVSEFEKMGAGLKNLSLCLPQVVREGRVDLSGFLSGKQKSAA
jgi:dimethylargininase